MELFYGGLNSLRYSPHHSQIKEKAKVKTAFSKAFLFLSFSFCVFFKEDDSQRWEKWYKLPRSPQGTFLYYTFHRDDKEVIYFRDDSVQGLKVHLTFGAFQFSLFFMAIYQESSQMLRSATFLHCRWTERAKWQFPYVSGIFPGVWSLLFGGNEEMVCDFYTQSPHKIL